MLIQSREEEIQRLKNQMALMASRNHTKAPQQEETPLPGTDGDGSEATVMPSDSSDETVVDSDSDQSDLGDPANVVLPDDDETPLEETSDKDLEVVVPECSRRLSQAEHIRTIQNMQKKWYDFEHEALGGKKVIENPSDQSLKHLMKCKFCEKWKKMRPWDPKHFIDHVNFHCRKYQQHLQAQQKRSASHGMHRFFGSKPTKNPEKEEAKAEQQ